MGGVTLRHYEGGAAQGLRELVSLIHREAYTEAIASGDPFSTDEAFMGRFDVYAARPGFRMVVAYLGDEPVGQAWGWPIERPTAPASWQIAGLGPEPADEAARRTFVLSEIMVRQAWTGQGIAHALHDELLLPCTERLAELFVRPANTRAYRTYLNWGWLKVTQVRPNFPDAPMFDVLVLPLPISKHG